MPIRVGAKEYQRLLQRNVAADQNLSGNQLPQEFQTQIAKAYKKDHALN
jgi:hypothetical protein